MGAISDCQAAGIPNDLIIPIRPWDAPDHRGNGRGKQPAMPDGSGDPKRWQPLDNWQRGGFHPAVLAQAEMYGANAGLLLGCPSGEWNFCAIDIDLDIGMEIHRDRILATLAASAGAPVFVRRTVPYRALVLVRIRQVSSDGRKTTYTIRHADPLNSEAEPLDIGKIELLTTGQQCVIAGRHHSGNTIVWHEAASTEHIKLTPPIHPDMWSFDCFLDLAEHVRAVLDTLAATGYTYEARASGGAGGPVGASDLAPQWLTVADIIRVLSATPNGQQVDRDTYVSFMLGAAASMRGIEANTGLLSTDSLLRIKNAAVEWSLKWHDPNDAMTGDERYAFESQKWDADWACRDEYHTNWYRFCAVAENLGLKGACAINAQHDFQPDLNMRLESIPEPADPDDVPINTIRPKEVLDYITNARFADFTLIDFVRGDECKMGQVARFVPALKKWLLWDGATGWQLSDVNNSHVEFFVQQYLKTYVLKYSEHVSTGERWKDGQISSLLSISRAERVVKGLGSILAIGQNEMNNSRYHLQTPSGTFDLRSMERIPTPKRKLQYDVRYTAVSPVFDDSQTPMFDDVLNHLADGNAEVVNWLWHYLGYCLLGHPRADCFVVIWGSGHNGKTVIANVMKRMLGEYATELNAEVLTEGGKRLHQTSLNRLRDRRMALVSEMPKDDKWNERILKMISGGDDIEARDMYQSATSFRSEVALLILCNELPAFSRVNKAILRRFRMIGTTKSPAKPDSLLEEKILKQESAALLGKLMRYANAVYKGNGSEHITLPPVPECMKSEAETVMKTTDPVFAWIADECNYGPAFADCEEGIDTLKSRFDLWLTRQRRADGAMPGDGIGERKFLESLRGIGVSTTDNKGNRIRKIRRDANGVVSEYHVVRGLELKVKVVAA